MVHVGLSHGDPLPYADVAEEDDGLEDDDLAAITRRKPVRLVTVQGLRRSDITQLPGRIPLQRLYQCWNLLRARADTVETDTVVVHHPVNQLCLAAATIRRIADQVTTLAQRARATLAIDDNEEDAEDDVEDEADDEDADEDEEDDSDNFEDDLTLDDIIGDVSGLDKGALC